MKQMSCAQIGGPATCTVMVTGNTADEVVQNGMAHVTEAHPDLLERIQKMTEEETTQWMTDFRKKFDAAPAM